MIKKFFWLGVAFYTVGSLWGCSLNSASTTEKNCQIKGVIHLTVANERQLLRFRLNGKDADHFNLQVMSSFYAELLEIDYSGAKNRVIYQGKVTTLDELAKLLMTKLGCLVPIKPIIDWLCGKVPQFDSNWLIKYDTNNKVIAAQDDDLGIVFEYSEILRPAWVKIVHIRNNLMLKLKITSIEC